MLLLYCASCKDAFNLSAKIKTCSCGLSSGKVFGDSIPVHLESNHTQLYRVSFDGFGGLYEIEPWRFSKMVVSKAKLESMDEKSNSRKEDCVRIIQYLNSCADTSFSSKYPSSHTKLIEERFKEHNCSVEEVIEMINRKVKLWKGTQYEMYLRPATLFNKTKFANYIGEKKNATGKTTTTGSVSLFDALDEAKRRISQDSAGAGAKKRD